jgi:hypothetical protein
MLKRIAVVFAIAAGCAFGQTILVSSKVLAVPAGLTPVTAANIGVLVVVQTSVGSIGKIEIRLDYYDGAGAVHEVRQTVSRTQTVGGFDPSPIPVLFAVQVASIAAVYVEGFSPSLVPQQPVD